MSLHQGRSDTGSFDKDVVCLSAEPGRRVVAAACPGAIRCFRAVPRLWGRSGHTVSLYRLHLPITIVPSKGGLEGHRRLWSHTLRRPGNRKQA